MKALVEQLELKGAMAQRAYDASSEKRDLAANPEVESQTKLC